MKSETATIIIPAEEGVNTEMPSHEATSLCNLSMQLTVLLRYVGMCHRQWKGLVCANSSNGRESDVCSSLLLLRPPHYTIIDTISTAAIVAADTDRRRRREIDHFDGEFAHLTTENVLYFCHP